MPNGNTAGAEWQYRTLDGAVPNRDIEGANKRDYSTEIFRFLPLRATNGAISGVSYTLIDASFVGRL